MHKTSQRVRALLLPALLGGLLSGGGGCKRAGGPGAQGQATHSLRELPPLPLQMAFPAAAKVTPLADGVRIEANPGHRSPRALTLTRQSGAAASAGAHVYKTRPGLRIQYDLKLTAGAGSGGDEQLLEGTAEVDGQRFRISCIDQAEAPAKPDAEWCLPWLVTLKQQR